MVHKSFKIKCKMIRKFDKYVWDNQWFSNKAKEEKIFSATLITQLEFFASRATNSEAVLLSLNNDESSQWVRTCDIEPSNNSYSSDSVGHRKEKIFETLLPSYDNLSTTTQGFAAYRKYCCHEIWIFWYIL